MRIRLPLILAVIGLLCGCAQERFAKGRGNVAQFIVQQAVVRCGLSSPTNDLPIIPGRWRYSEDEWGVVIQLPRERYPDIELLLRQTFGAPRFGPVDTLDGGKLGGYRLTPKGGGIQFGYNVDCTQVIVIRPVTEQEFGEALQKAKRDGRLGESRTE